MMTQNEMNLITQARKDGFAAGAASRDGEIKELQAKLDAALHGYQANWAREHLQLEQAKAEGIQIGRKEVMEFVEQNYPGYYYMFEVHSGKPENQLKLWGLEKKE
jgi:hypothetical protein